MYSCTYIDETLDVLDSIVSSSVDRVLYGVQTVKGLLVTVQSQYHSCPVVVYVYTCGV